MFCHLNWGRVPNGFGNWNGHCRLPEINDSFTASSSVLHLSRFWNWVSFMLLMENVAAQENCTVKASIFWIVPFVFYSIWWEITHDDQGGPSRSEQRTPGMYQDTGRKTILLVIHVWCWPTLVMLKNHWPVVYKVFLLFPQDKMTGMGPGHHWRPPQLGQWRDPTESTHMDVIKNKQEGKISVMSKVVTDFLYPRIPVALPTTDK